MAFINATELVGTNPQVIFTCPSGAGGKAAVIHGLYITNIIDDPSLTATIEVYDNSATVFRVLAKDINIRVSDSLLFDKPINLEEGDYIRVTTNINISTEVIAAILLEDPGDFVNASSNVGTNPQDIFTCPVDKEAVVHALYISNLMVDPTDPILYATVKLYDLSKTQEFTIIKDVQIPDKDSFVLDKPINMAAGDILRVTVDKDLGSDAFASVLIQDVVV